MLAAGAGTALGVNPQAEAKSTSEIRTLTVGADVFIGERIVTGPEGQVQIKFADQTKLVVGPKSSLVIEDYLLRADASAGKFVINALTGSFRFATGVSPKDSYVIKTPTGTIGIRGTEFDLSVYDGGSELMLFHGSVLLCNLLGKCVTLDDTCEVGQIDPADATVIGDAKDLDDETRETLRALFPYADSQTPLKPEFWFRRARQCLTEIAQLGFQTLSSSSSSNLPTPVTEPDDEDPECEHGDD